MRAVRNQIVHDGGQANPFKSQVELGLDSDFDDMLDFSFSKQYPQFVQGESPSAEVTVSEEQMIKGSVELVKWSVHELRMRELTEAVKDDDANPGRIELGQT